MPAPKGNQYAKGHGYGAPRTVCPDDDGIHELGRELLEWAKGDDKNERLRCHLNQWWALEKDMPKNMWKALCNHEIFMEYYEKAKIAIARKYIDGSVNASIAHRFMWHYFPEAEKQDKDKAKYESDLKKDQAQEFDGKLGEVLDHLKKLKND